MSYASYSASSVMTTPVISISPEVTLKEAINILAESKISGLPVVDADNKVVGVITEKDIVNYASTLHVIPLLRSSGWVSPHTDVDDIASFKKGYELLSNVKVEKVMSRKPHTVKKSAYIAEVANLMNKKNVNRIPVVDEEGKLAGIIARADLVTYLARRES